ncbi:MAG TPA: hypothetical protein P5234_05950 [Thermoanaerobaculaceae bacterium]|nr:hypothetical protein [Thermoanaerobaculaceae bacterium]HRS15779.1 hypothetical protein [Thermoanaerobaculaceae bacterium]
MLPLPPRSVAVADLLSLGFAAGIGQAVLLREAMAALGGSELAWGVVLAAWLGGMAAGARAGSRGGAGGPAGPVLALGLALVGVVLLRAAPAVAARAPGEVLSLARAVWAWAAAVLPASGVGGWAFSRLAAGAGGAAAYAWESLGSVAGGLAFTFALAPLGSAATLLAAAAAVGLAALAGRGRVWLAVGWAAALLLAASPTERWLAERAWRWSGRPGTLAVARHTRQQRLEVSTGTPAALYADSRLAAELPDPYRAALRAHLLALLHPRPARVLVVGAVPGELEPYLLRHPVERLDVAVEDPGLARLVEETHLAPALPPEQAARRYATAGDPLRIVRRGGPWDLVILADADPATLRAHRTRSREFVAACRGAMAAGGVLAVRVGTGDTYLGGAGGALLATLAATVRAELPVLAAIPGEEIWLVASRDELGLSAETLADRWHERGLDDPLFHPGVLPVLLDRARAETLEAFLRQAASPPTTAAWPRAVLLAAALAEGRAEGRLGRALARLERPAGWALPAGLAAWGGWLVLGGLRRRVSRAGLLATVGLCSIGWWLLMLAAWQATRGAVYAEVGALNAVLMAGLGAAALGLGRRPHLAERRLPGVLASGAAVSAAMVAWWVWGGEAWAVPPLLLLAGGAAGAAFPGAAALRDRRGEPLGAPRGFAADELGAALGAALLGLFGLPVLGAVRMGLVLGGLCLCAAAAATLARRRW